MRTAGDNFRARAAGAAGLAVWSVRFKASCESLFRTAVDGSASYVRVAAPGVRRRYVCGRVLQAI